MKLIKHRKIFLFKNKAPYRSWISKINKAVKDHAEDLDTVMLIYNLLEYNGNYLMTSGSLWNYYRDEMDVVDNNASEGK